MSIQSESEIQIKVEEALLELTSPAPKAAPLLDALQTAQSYLLTLPQGAHREILDKINDAIKKPIPPSELKITLESVLLYLKPTGEMLQICCKICDKPLFNLSSEEDILVDANDRKVFCSKCFERRYL